jgi:hypothetical protein
MFDNLRDSGDQFFYEEEQNDLYKEPEPAAAAQAAPVYAAPRKRRKSNNARFLGMTAQQRFFLSLMFMITVCIMGMLAMIVLGRMSLF